MMRFELGALNGRAHRLVDAIRPSAAQATRSWRPLPRLPAADV